MVWCVPWMSCRGGTKGWSGVIWSMSCRCSAVQGRSRTRSTPPPGLVASKIVQVLRSSGTAAAGICSLSQVLYVYGGGCGFHYSMQEQGTG